MDHSLGSTGLCHLQRSELDCLQVSVFARLGGQFQSLLFPLTSIIHTRDGREKEGEDREGRREGGKERGRDEGRKK